MYIEQQKIMNKFTLILGRYFFVLLMISSFSVYAQLSNNQQKIWEFTSHGNDLDLKEVKIKSRDNKTKLSTDDYVRKVILGRIDPNVWIYSQYFIDHFGMPERWLSNELPNPQALAWRTQQQTRVLCNSEDSNKNCMLVSECILEVYLDKKHRKTLKLIDKTALKPWHSSVQHILDKNPSLNEYANQSLSFPTARWSNNNSPISVLRYDISPRTRGLVNIVLLVDCTIGLNGKVDKPRSLTLTSNDGQSSTSITIPSNFWQRVERYMAKKNAKQRLLQKGDKLVDNSSWIYTNDFAEKYNLPTTHASNQLEGVEAIAYWAYPMQNERRHVWTECNFELYIKKDAKLVYLSDKRMDYYFDFDSWKMTVWTYKEMSLDTEVHMKHLNTMVDLAGIFYDKGGSLTKTAYWRNDVLLPGYQILRIEDTSCAYFRRAKKAAYYLVFGKEFLAPRYAWIKDDLEGNKYRYAHFLRIPAQFHDQARMKATRDWYCVYNPLLYLPANNQNKQIQKEYEENIEQCALYGLHPKWFYRLKYRAIKLWRQI